MQVLDFLNNLIDWKKNVLIDGSTSFSASFEKIKEDSMNQLKDDVYQLLEPIIDKFHFEDTDIPLSKDSFYKRNIKNVEIYPFERTEIQEIFFGENSVNISMLSNNINLETLSRISCKEELSLATYGDTNYRIWQDIYGVSAYKYKKGLKIIRDKKTGEKIVDISNRPGRGIGIKNIYYYGASKMWFGSKIYPHIPQELIINFPEAVEIKVLDNNVTFVNLYESIYDGFAPHNQEVQRRFREHIKIDSLKIE